MKLTANDILELAKADLRNPAGLSPERREIAEKTLKAAELLLSPGFWWINHYSSCRNSNVVGLAKMLGDVAGSGRMQLSDSEAAALGGWINLVLGDEVFDSKRDYRQGAAYYGALTGVIEGFES